MLKKDYNVYVRALAKAQCDYYNDMTASLRRTIQEETEDIDYLKKELAKYYGIAFPLNTYEQVCLMADMCFRKWEKFIERAKEISLKKDAGSIDDIKSLNEGSQYDGSGGMVPYWKSHCPMAFSKLQFEGKDILTCFTDNYFNVVSYVRELASAQLYYYRSKISELRGALEDGPQPMNRDVLIRVMMKYGVRIPQFSWQVEEIAHAVLDHWIRIEHNAFEISRKEGPGSPEDIERLNEGFFADCDGMKRYWICKCRESYIKLSDGGDGPINWFVKSNSIRQ